MKRLIFHEAGPFCELWHVAGCASASAFATHGEAMSGDMPLLGVSIE